MIRLENMESLEEPGLFEDAQVELEELAALIRREGIDVYVAQPGEPVHAYLQHSADQAFVEALNVVFDAGVEASVTLAIEKIVRRWARRRRRFRDREGAKATVPILGPDGEILKVVELPEPDDGAPR